jgi:hypothetical protein
MSLLHFRHFIARSVTKGLHAVASLPDGSAIDPIIDEPLVQSHEYVIHGTARRELHDKERNNKNREEPRED